MKYWFTADTHFGHGNIIKYSNRPFRSANHMDEVIIKNWNEKVNKEDVVYHLGDFGFTRKVGFDLFSVVKNIINKLNGQINLLLGNHDYQNYNQKALSLFASVADVREKNINGIRVVMCHYPMIVWPGKHKGSIMLCGHSHNNLPATRKDSKYIGKILDVGVDGNNYYPYSFEDVIKIMNTKPMFPDSVLLKDHHKGDE